MKRTTCLILFFAMLLMTSCNKKNSSLKQDAPNLTQVKERLKAYAPVLIKADMSHLTDRQRTLVKKLCEAGHIADEIFWQQCAPDAIPTRDSLLRINTPEAKTLLDYVNINYGPYDVIYGNERFVGKGPQECPAVAGYYPLDMTREEFEKHLAANPADKESFMSQYTVIRREGGKLAAVPYYKAYPDLEKLAAKLEEAAQYADDPGLKNYLVSRAQSFRTGDYFSSDMAWMDIKNSDVDLVIGPIENYQDRLFGYKSAFEAVIMVKDIEGTKELEMFRKHIADFEARLPYDKKYIRRNVSDQSQLNIVNVVYFGGDCQKGTKTIAASLPNDPKVREAKGGKNSMYKNMMEAKFDKTLVPIARKVLEPGMMKYIDKKAFIGFVTLHEVSHTLGRGYVFGNDKLEVRTALKEKYSAIEETKADILSMLNHKHLADMKELDAAYIKNCMITYLAGLFRSVRFGTESAHAKANLIQFNFLRGAGAVTMTKDGKYAVNESIFFDKVAELAKLVLTVEAEGNYKGAGEILAKYAVVTDEIKKAVDLLKDVPRDIDTSYEF